MASKLKSLVLVQTMAALVLVSGAWADQVIQPSNGKGWGDGTTAESLLNMNRDPEVVRKVDPENVPIQVRGTCTDENGKTYEGDDDEYSLCMNHKNAKAKAPAVTPASVSKKN
jgi:hypothetical protein